MLRPVQRVGVERRSRRVGRRRTDAHGGDRPAEHGDERGHRIAGGQLDAKADLGGPNVGPRRACATWCEPLVTAG